MVEGRGPRGMREGTGREWEKKGGPQGVAVMTISAGPTSRVGHSMTVSSFAPVVQADRGPRFSAKRSRLCQGLHAGV